MLATVDVSFNDTAQKDGFMSRRHHIRTGPLPLLALLLVLSGAAYAANVSSQTRPDYQRVLFDFGAPTRMQVASGKNSVSLTFSKPITGNIAAVAAKMNPYVTGASLSADKKTVTLSMNKQYRVRQFISGEMVGVDILTNTVTSTPPAPKPEAPPAPKPTPPKPEKPPVVKPAPVKKPDPVKETPKAELKPEPQPELKTIRDEPPAADLLTTKPTQPEPEPVKEAPKPEPKAEATPEPETPVMAAPVQEKDPLLTTKAEPVPEVKPEATPATAPETVASSKETATQEPVAAEPETIEPEQAATETALPQADPGKPFLINAKTTKAGTEVNFPWGERTAAAVFERAHDIWIVFDRERDAKPQLLASLLPKQVVRVQQYKLSGATVLRLTTDGSIHAGTSQPEGTYEWNVMFSTAMPRAALDIPVSAETEEGRRQLLLGAFDVATPLRFYDPTLNDRLVVVPTFEVARGVATLKQFPELDVLPTQQGIAIASRRDDLSVRRTRSGLKLLGDSSLAVSDNLPIYSAGAQPVPGASAAANVLMPYDQWYVGAADFAKEREARLRAISSATPAQAADSAMRMVQLYLGQGMAVEALGYLDLLKEKYPNYYADRKLAVLHAATYVMLDRLPEAAQAISAPELEGVDEAAMWRELISVFAPTATSTIEKVQAESEAETAAQQAVQAAIEGVAETTGDAPPVIAPPLPVRPAVFDFLGYNPSYIRYYPPRIRQRLAVMAADAYARNSQEEEALKTFDTLNRDGILDPVQSYAEYTLASVAAKKGKVKEALATYDRLAKHYEDPYIQAKSRYAAILLRYTKGMETPDRTAEALESLRLSWRGDALQRDILFTLAEIYRDNKRYDDTLRTWKYLLDNFPEDPDTLTISGDMAELFENLFLNGKADDMPPLKSLALFYEFRELTPIGAKGDEIIQKLADRLAAVDLLDRATQLLENQIKFRLSGEERARVGARLALLYLLNHQPNEALGVLEVTNYGDAPLDLRRQRIQLTAQALSNLGKHEEALSMLFHDDSSEADLLRLDILWAMKDWPNVINTAEDILSNRPNLTATLNQRETEVLMKLALGYSFEGDTQQLGYLRDYYSGLLPESQYKEIFTFLTNDTAPLDPEDFELVAKQISNTESFLDMFRTKIAAGNLSDTVK